MAATSNADPNYTVIIIAEDGRAYSLTREKWELKENVLTDAGGQGVVQQLKEFGAYLSFIPPEIAVGVGGVCAVVNLRAILKGKGGSPSDY